MNRSIRCAALALLLSSAALFPADAAEDPPPAAPRAPLPADPKEAVRKKLQEAIRKWFEHEPAIPLKGKTEVLAKAGRADASGEIETLVLEWNRGITPNNCMRLMAFWRSRLEETHPSENKPTGIKPKEEFTVYGRTWTFAVSIPNTYRGKGTDLLPVILTVIDKDADPRKVFPEAYGKLVDTHLIVASREPAVTNAGALVNGIYYAHLNYRIDRDRVTLDGIGKGARFVEELAASEYACLQWNGVVIRNPSAIQPLEGNFGLFPVAVVEQPPAAPDGVKEAAEAHRAAGDPGSILDASKIPDFIAALPPSKAHDQGKPYTVHFKSTGRMPKWGYWFTVDQAVDAGADQPVRVAISRDAGRNVVDIDATNLAEGTLLLNDDVLDLDQPVHVRVNGIVVAKERVLRNVMNTFDWSKGWATHLIAPRHYFITGALPFVVEGEARIPKVERDRAAAAEKQAQEEAKRAEEDRKKQEALDAEAAKRAEEEAKNPTPADPVPPSGPSWFTSLADAQAAAGGKPVFVVFAAPADNGLQKAVVDALASPDAKSALAGVACVILPPENAEGTALLAELSKAADTARPCLALLNVQGMLSLAGLKEEEVAAKIAEFLKLLQAPKAPEAPPAPEKVEWGGDYKAAEKLASESGSTIVIDFTASGDAKGGKELQDALLNDAECTRSLSKMICVRLDTQGEAGKANLEFQKTVDGSHTPPVLYLVQINVTDKWEVSRTTPDVVDPLNLLADATTFLPKVREALKLAVEKKGTTGPRPKWHASLPEAKAAAGTNPVLVLFAAAADDGLQKALDAALDTVDARKALIAGYSCVRIAPAAEGDAGKDTRDLLAKMSGAADAKVPYLVFEGRKGTLAVGSLKPEGLKEEVVKFLAPEAPPQPAR